MPIVPFTPTAPKREALPSVNDPWLLMAAAQMDAEGRLVEKDEPAEEDANG